MSSEPAREESPAAPVDVESVMAEIRERVKNSLESGELSIPRYQSTKVSPEDVSVSPVLYSAELNYLNANWHNWNSSEDISSHRPVIGWFIVKSKKLVSRLAQFFFKTYFEREREFQTHLVRFLNALVRYTDDKDSEIFWRIINKVDSDVLGVNERIDRIYDESNSTLRDTEQGLIGRLARLEADRDILRQTAEQSSREIEHLDSLIRGLERTTAIVADSVASNARGTRSAESGPQETGPSRLRGTNGTSGSSSAEGINYLLLENRYRGSEELIKERLQDYVELFRGAEAPVVELGCGRGEFLESLVGAGIKAFGVDLNPSMVACCKQKGLNAVESDAIAYLEQLADHSIGGVFAAQLVEHLDRDVLSRLLELASQKVIPGGRIAFETINPQSFTALACNFFRDPTHVWPLHPDTMRFMMEMKGIRTETVMMRSPYPVEATLRPLEISGHLPARWRDTLLRINDNITVLNRHLFGHQDYCVVGVAEQAASRAVEPASPASS